ncbi:hypothetical protein [Streptomyces europaeiscabiei]|uniref:hypothetical protein n=1 Tax=Streptomyces europaeiscabiei TaxID=146819 RepID=UPI0029BD122E|nr:hypothetical protein [Streptomyces europaeiscabiei]MDX3589062.1 hypothetical protein [Streptomyces europaeiscabiei]
MTFAESYLGSSDFWNTTITVAAGMMVGFLGAWAALKANNPRRRINWMEGPNFSVLREEAGSPSSVTVSHASGIPLLEPRIAQLVLENDGRRDVQSADFLQGDDSLAFDFGATIVEVQPVSRPSSAPIPPASVSGSVLKIKASPLLQKQRVTYTVLLDGPQKHVEVIAAAIQNTPVKQGAPVSPYRNILITLATVASCVFLLLGVLIGGMTANSFPGFPFGQPFLQKCRYWDKYEPSRSAAECPKIEKPLK